MYLSLLPFPPSPTPFPLPSLPFSLLPTFPSSPSLPPSSPHHLLPLLPLLLSSFFSSSPLFLPLHLLLPSTPPSPSPPPLSLCLPYVQRKYSPSSMLRGRPCARVTGNAERSVWTQCSYVLPFCDPYSVRETERVREREMNRIF